MSQPTQSKNQSQRSRSILVGLGAFVAVALICGVTAIVGVALFGVMEAPSETPDATRQPDLPPKIEVEMSAAADVANSTLGQLTVNRPLRMSPGSSDSFFVALRIPEQLASTIPIEVEIITIPEDAPPVIGQRGEDMVPLLVTAQMRAEIVAPTFVPVSTDPAIQPVNLAEIDDPTFWVWTLTAPTAVGLHDVTLKIHQVHPDGIRLAIPPRIYKIEVVPLPGTEADEDSFWQSPLGVALVGGLFTILATVIGAYLGREHLPVINSTASKRRRLQRLANNLNYLQEQAANYGPNNVPLKLHNDIAATREAIAQLEQELAEV
jgi:hypothetical protein